MNAGLSRLVQIGSGSWVDPAEVKRIYTCQSTLGDKARRYTYVMCTGMGGSLFDEAPSDHVIYSDWPIDRISNALGLINADTLDAQFEDQHE